MKKTKLIIVAILSLIVTSCSNDDNGNDNGNNDPSIIGTWKTTKEVFVDSEGIMTTNNRDDCEQMGRTVFSSDGNFSDSGYYSNCTVDWENNGNWEIISGNILRITLVGQVDNGYIEDYLIIESTSNSLKIDADLDASSIEQEIYELEKVN